MDEVGYTVLNREEMKAQIAAARAQGLRCYVYGLCRGDTSRVFYCGKGTGPRFFQHEKEMTASHKFNIIRKHGVSGYVLFSVHKTDQEAFDAEKLVISTYPHLANELPGGEGFDSYSARRYATAIQQGRTL